MTVVCCLLGMTFDFLSLSPVVPVFCEGNAEPISSLYLMWCGFFCCSLFLFVCDFCSVLFFPRLKPAYETKLSQTLDLGINYLLMLWPCIPAQVQTSGGKKTCTPGSGGDTRGTPAWKVHLRMNPVLDGSQKLLFLETPAKKDAQTGE